MNFLIAAEGAAGENGYLLPHVFDEFIWGSVAFSIVLGAFLWKGLPAIRSAMAANAAQVEADLAAAEQSRQDAEAELAALTSSLGDTSAEAERIVSEAREQAVKLEADLVARAEAEMGEARDRARVDIEVQREQALADLRSAVAAQARQAADAVVRNNLDESTQRSLIDDYISRVSAG